MCLICQQLCKPYMPSLVLLMVIALVFKVVFVSIDNMNWDASFVLHSHHKSGTTIQQSVPVTCSCSSTVHTNSAYIRNCFVILIMLFVYINFANLV